VAKELREQFPSSQKICCQRSGILWDFAALYSIGVEWGNAAPSISAGQSWMWHLKSGSNSRH
jgi:hypothetical protein